MGCLLCLLLFFFLSFQENKSEKKCIYIREEKGSLGRKMCFWKGGKGDRAKARDRDFMYYCI